MKRFLGILGGLAAALAVCAPAHAQTPAGWSRFDAQHLQLRGLAAIVRVIPEQRGDIAVSIQNAQGRLPTPTAQVSGSRLIIDGGINRGPRECRGEDDFAANVSGRGWINSAQLPMIEVRVPEDVVISTERVGAKLLVAPARTARVSMNGCGAVDLRSVAGAASLTLGGGSVEIRLHHAQSAEVQIATSGSVSIGSLSEGLAASIAGSGAIDAAHVDGPTNIAIQGSGAVHIESGRAAPLSVVMTGAGEVRHGGVATDVDAVVMGSGLVHVREAEGRVARRVLGSGAVTIGP